MVVPCVRFIMFPIFLAILKGKHANFLVEEQATHLLPLAKLFYQSDIVSLQPPFVRKIGMALLLGLANLIQTGPPPSLHYQHRRDVYLIQVFHVQ